MKSYQILFLTLAFIFSMAFCLQDDDELRCTHDDLEQNPIPLDIREDMPPTDSEGRILASSYPQIRMYAHYDLLNSAPSSYKAYIQNELVPPVLSYFQAAIKVKYPITDKLILAPGITEICDVKVPSILYAGVSSDYFLMLDSEFDGRGSWVANSFICYMSAQTKRPFVVKTIFNRNLLQDANGDVLVHEKNTYLLMHELIHNFGFTREMFQYYLDDNGQARKNHIKSVSLNGSTRIVLDVPSLTSRLRKFFGCPTLEGAYMENNGGSAAAGSHFERRHFVYETMTSGVIHGRRISEFSLGMIEATGWYAVDYSFAEPYFFGQGQGCGFLKNSCTSPNFNFDEFCKGNNQGCAPQGRGGGYCNKDSKSDGCRYYAPNVDLDCENPNAKTSARLPELQTFGRGLGSKCFTGDLTAKKSATETSFCFKFTCQGSGTNTYLQVQVGTQKVTCQREGEIQVPGYNGSLNCPDPLTFCNTVGKPYCPRNCMGRGKCVNNKCVCWKGYTGVDCGLNI